VTGGASLLLRQRRDRRRRTGKMPFKFSGTLKKVEIKLAADQLTPQKRGELERLKTDFALRMQ
jgi:hypothetical protein